MPRFSSLLEFSKWHKSIQRRYNAGTQNGLPSPGGRTKAVAQHDPRVFPRPHASQLRKPQTGAVISRCDIQGPCQPLRSPTGESSRDTAPSAGGLPAHQMAKRDIQSRPSIIVSESPSSPTLQCPDDCDSKKFCDPSSCSLESVREANVIVERLRRAN